VCQRGPPAGQSLTYCAATWWSTIVRGNGTGRETGFDPARTARRRAAVADPMPASVPRAVTAPGAVMKSTRLRPRAAPPVRGLSGSSERFSRTGKHGPCAEWRPTVRSASPSLERFPIPHSRFPAPRTIAKSEMRPRQNAGRSTLRGGARASTVQYARRVRRVVDQGGQTAPDRTARVDAMPLRSAAATPAS
jgi:hypothetical protein